MASRKEFGWVCVLVFGDGDGDEMVGQSQELIERWGSDVTTRIWTIAPPANRESGIENFRGNRRSKMVSTPSISSAYHRCSILS